MLLKQFSSNYITNIFVLIVNSCIGLFLVPFYIENLGLTAYALIPLTTSLSSFVILILDSINSSSQRYFAKEVHYTNNSEAATVFNTALFGTLIFALLFIPISAGVAYLSSILVHIDILTTGSTFILIFVILLIGLFNIWCNNFSNVFFVKNRLDINNYLKISQIFFQVIILYILFQCDFKTLKAYVVSYGISVFIYFIETLVVALKYTSAKISYKKFNSDKFKKICNFGFWNILNSIGNLLFLDASLILSGFLLGLEAEGTYSIAVKIVSLIISIGAATSFAFSPIQYKQYFNGNLKGLKQTCGFAIEVNCTFITVLIAFICVFHSQLINVWVGPGYNSIDLPITIMLIATAISCTVVPTYCTSVMMKKLRVPSIVTILFGIFNIALALILVDYFKLGILGLAIAWSVSVILKNCLFNTAYHSVLLFNNTYGILKFQITPMIFFIIFYIILSISTNTVAGDISIIYLIAILLTVELITVFLLSRKIKKYWNEITSKKDF